MCAVRSKRGLRGFVRIVGRDIALEEYLQCAHYLRVVGAVSLRVIESSSSVAALSVNFVQLSTRACRA